MPPGAGALHVVATGGAGTAGGGLGAQVTADIVPATSTLFVDIAGGGTGQHGNGGSAADIRTCSQSGCALPGGTDTRLIVAGGGGGGGGGSSIQPGGNAGEAASGTCAPGSAGTTGNGASSAGQGGTCTAGGAAGAGSLFSGNPGSAGRGGSGTPGFTDSAGGGGGYSGGGSSGEDLGNRAAGGGGGGSSFAAASAASVTFVHATSRPAASVTITCASPPDLALSDIAPAAVTSSQPYSYTLIATSTGGLDATGVTVAGTLPGSVHFGTVTVTSQGTCARTPGTAPKTKGGTVSCTVASLAAGASVTATITVTPVKPGTISDGAQATAGNVTPDSDDRASAAVTVQGS